MADKSNNGATDSKRGPSLSLLVIGLLALGVSAWAFVPEHWPGSSVPVGWIAVLGAILIGILLVVSPRKRR
ncbi:hypothetical protein [Nocardia sp. NPDC049149]|uniref:hypothetical protein n=1 Tax=Nocardia sp. NPDC049149 TaxID=3364315 RepID=UPI00371E0CA5